MFQLWKRSEIAGRRVDWIWREVYCAQTAHWRARISTSGGLDLWSSHGKSPAASIWRTEAWMRYLNIRPWMFSGITHFHCSQLKWDDELYPPKVWWTQLSTKLIYLRCINKQFAFTYCKIHSVSHFSGITGVINFAQWRAKSKQCNTLYFLHFSECNKLCFNI